MSHGKTMLEMAKKKEPMTKNWKEVLDKDMDLDKTEAKLKAKAKTKAMMKKCK